MGREEATIEFVTGGDALSPDQTGGGGEDVEGGGSPAQIVVGRSCEMGSSQAAAGVLGLGLERGGKERATGHPSEGGLAFDTAGWGGSVALRLSFGLGRTGALLRKKMYFARFLVRGLPKRVQTHEMCRVV